jgi:hypothetical protein
MLRRFLVFLMIFIIIYSLMENLRSKARYQFEPVETFERERFLWRARINGRASLDIGPHNNESAGRP